MREKFGIETFADNVDVVRRSKLIVLSVKPHQMEAVLGQIRDFLTPEHFLISVAAGKTLPWMQSLVGPRVRLARTMVNTPSIVGEMAGAYSLGEFATKEDEETLQLIMGAIGVGFPLEEKLLDAVTGLAGSGPAYVFTFIEALADGGVKQGLPRQLALKMAIQTVYGAAKMLKEMDTHPAVLRDSVASPGGTTIHAIHELERAGFRDAAIRAVEASTKRSKELSGNM